MVASINVKANEGFECNVLAVSRIQVIYMTLRMKQPVDLFQLKFCMMHFMGAIKVPQEQSFSWSSFGGRSSLGDFPSLQVLPVL